jgi:hypothetical protein
VSQYSNRNSSRLAGGVTSGPLRGGPASCKALISSAISATATSVRVCEIDLSPGIA